MNHLYQLFENVTIFLKEEKEKKAQEFSLLSWEKKKSSFGGIKE